MISSGIASRKFFFFLTIFALIVWPGKTLLVKITNPLYLNTTTFIPIINTLDTNALLFIIDTLLESFKLMNIDKIKQIEKESLKSMSNEEICDTIIRFISELKLKL